MLRSVKYMISTQTLLTTIMSQAESLQDAQNGLQTEAINGSASNDDLKNDSDFDPNTFVLLLSQVVANIPEQTINTGLVQATNGQTDTEAKSINSLLTEPNLTAEGARVNDVITHFNAEDSLPPIQQVLLDSLGLNVQDPVVMPHNVIVQHNEAAQHDNLLTADSYPMNENPAVSWIESQSVPAMVTAGNVTAQTAHYTSAKSAEPSSGKNNSLSDTRNKNDALFMSLGSDVKTADTQELFKQNDVVTTSPAGDNYKENLIQSLQQLNAGVQDVSKAALVQKTETIPAEMLPTANNTQPISTMSQVSHTPNAPAKALDIPLPINHPQWSNKLSEHIVWLGHNDIKSAVIKINPEELGPLEINVKVVNDSASVSIISHNAHVRDIVDQAIPRLRDMMIEQGLQLSDVQVNADHHSNQFAQQGNNNNDQPYERVFANEEEEVQLVTSVKKGPKRLVDYFA